MPGGVLGMLAGLLVLGLVSWLIVVVVIALVPVSTGTTGTTATTGTTDNYITRFLVKVFGTSSVFYLFLIFCGVLFGVSILTISLAAIGVEMYRWYKQPVQTVLST